MEPGLGNPDLGQLRLDLSNVEKNALEFLHFHIFLEACYAIYISSAESDLRSRKPEQEH